MEDIEIARNTKLEKITKIAEKKAGLFARAILYLL